MKSFFLFLFLIWGWAAEAQSSSLTVIGNPKGAPSELSFTELRSILKGERQRWSNGTKILIALMKTNTDVGRFTSSKIYNMSPEDVKKFWLMLVFQGKADAPTFFNTIAELQAFVSENPGAIGIVDAPSGSYDTQVVLIDGKRTL